MTEKRTVVDVECLLKNGREVCLLLELGRDTITEVDGVLTYIVRPEDGLTVETSIPRSEVAYLKQTTREEHEISSEDLRTLGRALAQSR